MQRSELNKRLTAFIKADQAAAAAVNGLERGLITFEECLRLLADAEHAAGIRAASPCSNCKYFSVCGDLDRSEPCKGKAAND